MVLDASLLNTQHYKVWMKGKVEQSRKWSSALSYTLGVVAIEKGAFGSPSTKGRQLYFFTFPFPKGISLQVNVRAWLEFELVYYNVKVQYVSHYLLESGSPCGVMINWLDCGLKVREFEL